MAHGIADIPLYQWLLAEHIDDRDKREWLAALLLRPLLNVDCVVGAEIDGRLVGLVGWQPHDVNYAPDGEAPLTPADVEVAVRTPGLRERLLELWTSPPLPSPTEDAVNCFLTVISPELRGGRILLDMVQKIEDYCTERGRRYYAWTASPKFRDWMISGWNSSQFDQIEWNGVTMYGLVSRDLLGVPAPSCG